MAWNMSASKRRALVKLQLRDKNGRWIEMGRGVKWYSSKRKKEIGGTVVGSQGEYALVRLNKENPTHEPALVKVPARHIEVVSSKATLSDPNAEKSNLETPEFEEPEAVGRKQSNAFIKPSDTPEDYSISETSDGNTYISRKDGEQLYFPARSLDVGDELIAPDGADETKPFSMGKAWAKKGAERLNTAGPKTGKVISIEGDRYAIVQLPEGHTVDDKKNPGEQTDKVTVGLSNSVIKLTPGLKAALAGKLEDNFADTSQDDGEEEEVDPNSDDAQSDHIGREVTDEQLAKEDEDEDFQEPEEKPTKSVATLRGKALDELEFGVENMEADGTDPGVRIKGTKVEIYDYDDAIRTIDGPLGVAEDNMMYPEEMTAAERTAARSKIRGLSALKAFIEEEQENEAAASEAPQSAENTESSPEAASPAADAPEAPEQAADGALNENGLTADDQKLADGYVRMAKRADDKGEFEAADRYQAMADALFQKGEAQKNAPEAPEEAPEAPAEPEPVEQPAPKLVEPTDPVGTDPKSVAKSLTKLQKAMIVAMRDHGWNSGSKNRDIRTGAVRNSLQERGLIRFGSSKDNEPAFIITDEGTAVADVLSPPATSETSKPELPPLVEGEELELPIPGLKKQGKRADKSAQHLKTLEGLDKGDRVSHTNAHDETSTYQKHEDGTWDLLDPEDDWEDQSPLEEALTADQIAQRHKRGELVVSTVEEQEEALREESYKNSDEGGKKYFDKNREPKRDPKVVENRDLPKTQTTKERDEQEANSADKPWSAEEIQSDIREWFDFAQAVKDGDTRAIETMANNKRTGDEETTIVVNDKGQPVDVTLTYNDDGDPVVRLSNFDDSKDIYGDFEIDKSVMSKQLSTLIHESINADDIAAAVAERNGSSDIEETEFAPVISRYAGHGKGTLTKAISEDPDAGVEINGNTADVTDLDKAQDFLRDLVNEIQSKISDPKTGRSIKISLNAAMRDINALLADVNKKQFERDGKYRPNRALRDEPVAGTPELDAVEPVDPDFKAAEDRYNKFADEAQNLPGSDPRRAAWDSAMDNGHQSTLEGIERFSKEWYEIVNSSYTSALNDLEGEASTPPMPVYPDTVDPNQFPYEFVPRGTIITHSKTGKPRVVVNSSRQGGNTPRDHITTRNMRDGKPFGPVLENAPGDFDERDELQRLVDEPETSAPEVDAPAAESGPKTSIDAWRDSLDEITEATGDPTFKDAGNWITAAIQSLNGLDGNPSVVADREEFDALPGKKLFRGVAAEADSERFMAGPNWVGAGGSGSGIYTSTNKFRGETFKRADGGALMEMKLSEGANIVDGDALDQERKRDLEKAIAEDDAVGQFLAEGDLGRYASARGLDGYSLTPNDQYDDDEEFVVLTNRNAVSVLGNPVKTAEDVPEEGADAPEADAPEAPEAPEVVDASEADAPGLDENGLTPEEQRDLEVAREEANLGGQVDSDTESTKAYQKAIDDILETGRRRLAGEDTASTPEEVSDTVEESEWVNPLDALDIVRREPMAIDGESYPPTQQQQDVIDAVLAGLDTKVQAMAGTGKTSTLVALSRRIKEHGKQAIYIAFNKTVQTEAEERMEGLPVEAKTGHGVAYQWALKNAPHLIARLNGTDFSRPIKFDKNGKPSDWAVKKPITAAYRIAGMLNISNGDIKDENGNDLKANTTVLAVKKTVESFALSDKDEVDLAHIPESFEIREEDQQKIVDLAKEYWNDLTKEDGNFRITHDVYRKQWALSRPDLTDGSGGNKAGANILYIDEAQDTPPVLAKVVADQKMQKVIVGDPNQAIYAFAENIDYLSEADGDVELPLNKSWRFGPEVADIGNRFLQVLGSKDRVVGGGGESQIVYGMEDADAVLVRTNAGMVNAILQEVRNGRRVSAPKGTRENLDSLTRTVQGLMAADPIDNPHDDLIGFKNWGEVLNAYNNGDNNVSMIVKLYDVVDAYSLARLTGEEIANLKKRKMEDAVKAVDNLVITVPKSETIEITQEGGRTWLSPVEVHPDKKMAEKWTGNAKKYAVKNFSQELGKVRAPEAFDKSLPWSQQMEEYHRQGGLGKLGFRFDSGSGRWYTDDAEAAQKIRSFTGEFDVTVSTAHKSKGLEWDRVRIGDDFFVPKEKDGQVEMVEDGELKLGYVAVTRAAKELDPGPLSWVFDSQYSDPNGGDLTKQRPVATPDETQDVVPESPAVEDTTPAPEQVTEEAPIETTPDTEEALEDVAEDSLYDDDGLSPTEAARVAELDQQMADIYSGKSDADLKPVENEWNDILAHGERRKKGEDLPEYENPVDVEDAPEVAPEPEAVPEPVVEEAPAPEEIPEPVVEPTPEPEVAPEPEYDAEGLTAAERARTDALEQAIYDAYRARKQETAKHLDTELQEILARGAERLKPKKPAPAPAPVESADKPKRGRRDFSNVPVHDANGAQIKAGDTIGHKRLGPVVVTGFLPAAGRVTYIDPSTNKEASVKGAAISIISEDVATSSEVTKVTGEPGDRFTDLTTGKQGFYGANGEPIIVGQRVTTSDGRSGLVKSVYTAKSGVAWIPVQWDDNGKITRIYGNLLSLEGGSGGNGGGGSPEPEAPEPTAPEAPEVPETPSVPEVAPALSIKDSVENYSGTEGFASSYDPETFSGNPLSALGIRRFEEITQNWSELRRDMVTQYDKGADGSTLTHGVKVWAADTGEYMGLVQNVEVYADDISIRIRKTTERYEREKTGPNYDPDYHSKTTVYDPKELISKPPTLWDGSYVDFSQAESVEELNSLLFKNYPSVHFNIAEDLELKQAKLLAKAISANFRKFPMLENSMNEVTTVTPDDNSIASLGSIIPSVAIFSDQHLNINPYSAAEFRQHVNDGRGGWFNDVPNGKQADYIVTHEMGHALDGLTGWTGSARVYELLREYLAEQGITGLSNSELAKYLVDNGMISEYSAEMWNRGIDSDEMVAEAFADVEINGINAKPVNKMIHKELMTRLEGMMQG